MFEILGSRKSFNHSITMCRVDLINFYGLATRHIVNKKIMTKLYHHLAHVAASQGEGKSYAMQQFEVAVEGKDSK